MISAKVTKDKVKCKAIGGTTEVLGEFISICRGLARRLGEETIKAAAMAGIESAGEIEVDCAVLANNVLESTIKNCKAAAEKEQGNE